MYYRVLVASQRFHGTESLTYASEVELKPGQIVEVPLQKQKVLGIVEKKTTKPSFKTKNTTATWDIQVPQASMLLLDWIKKYYPAPLGIITELFTPPTLAKKITADTDIHTTSKPNITLPPLTVEQSKVVSTIDDSQASSFLLHGQTGSGKTRVYLELIKKCLDNNQSTLLLTPEIGLTEPLIEQCKALFGERALITHSELTAAQRRNIWLRVHRAETPLVVIGPRSALFMPYKNLGAIIIDEFHDSAYKQGHAPYYQTTRVAAALSRLHDAKLILGSATPTVTDYFFFKQKKLSILSMNKLATGKKAQLETYIIDQAKRDDFSRSAYLSNQLLMAIEEALSNGEQSLLFLNRRGSARLILCDNCGWQAICPHCDTNLTFHADTHRMKCHSCDYGTSPPSACPECNTGNILYKSVGTKTIEGEILRLFPGTSVARFDGDTLKSERLHKRYEEVKSGKISVIIGTQSIAKGFDLPELGVVGIVNADSSLLIPDYSANERTYQIISQVSGRIGRGHRPGKLYIQTYQPKNPLFDLVLKQDFKSFLENELAEREAFKFPPYYFLAKLTCIRTSSQAAQKACEKLKKDISGSQGIIVEGPAPRFVEKVAGKYGWHLIIKARDRNKITDLISNLPSQVIVDLDPSDLL